MRRTLLTLCLLSVSPACDASKRARSEPDGAAVEPQQDASAPPPACSERSPCAPDAMVGTVDAAPACGPCATWSSHWAEPEAPEGLRIEAPASIAPGTVFPIAVRAANGFSGTVSLTTPSESLELNMHSGAGTATLTAPANGTLTLTARVGNRKVTEDIAIITRPARALTGELGAADLHWQADADIQLTGVTLVPAGQTLTIDPDTRVSLGPNARLEVHGTVRANGSPEGAIVFHASSAAWGELDFRADSHGELSHVIITGGGGDATRAFGHSNSQPMVRVGAAQLSIAHGLIAQAVGKAFGASSAQVTLSDTLIAHVDTGGEFSKSVVHLTRTHTVEIPDADGIAQDDDNDGMYLVGAFVDGVGKEQSSVLRDVVLAVGEDDGIDHNDAWVQVHGARIRGFHHEGIATSGGRGIRLSGVEVSGCEQGIELGYADPAVSIERAYLHDNGVGLRVGDSYAMPILGHMSVDRSVIARNGTDVRNHSNELMGPVLAALALRCSFLGETAEPGECNAAGEPQTTCALASSACDCQAPLPPACP
jgi:hypothetical protein